LTAYWNKWIDRNPAEVYSELSKGFPLGSRTNLRFKIDQEGTGELGFVLKSSDGRLMAKADRLFWPDQGIAIDNLFKVEAEFQSQDIARAHVSSLLLDFHKPLGIGEVAVSAALEAGGYTWARAGFVPTPTSWKVLRTELMRRYEGFGINNPFVLGAILDDDPRSIWDVVDSEYGRRLLLRTDWKGSLDLTDEEALQRLKRFGGR
jgi:hypothetical protein